MSRKKEILSKDKIQKIEKKKLAFLKEKNIDEAELSFMLVNIIKNKLSFEIKNVNFPEKLEGMILVDSEGKWTNGKKCKIIGVNNNLTSNEKRFTVAHELAHYILEDNRDVVAYKDHSVKDENRNEIEDEADYLAGSILMPYSIIKPEIEALNMLYTGEQESKKYVYLTEKYQVDLEAVLYREEEIELLNKDDK